MTTGVLQRESRCIRKTHDTAEDVNLPMRLSGTRATSPKTLGVRELPQRLGLSPRPKLLHRIRETQKRSYSKPGAALGPVGLAATAGHTSSWPTAIAAGPEPGNQQSSIMSSERDSIEGEAEFIVGFNDGTEEGWAIVNADMLKPGQQPNNQIWKDTKFTVHSLRANTSLQALGLHGDLDSDGFILRNSPTAFSQWSDEQVRIRISVEVPEAVCA